jgi:hypothetical protein
MGIQRCFALTVLGTLLLAGAAACSSSSDGPSGGSSGGSSGDDGSGGTGDSAGSAPIGSGGKGGSGTAGAGKGGAASAGSSAAGAGTAAGASGSSAGGPSSAGTGNAGPLPPALQWEQVAATAGLTWEGIWGSGSNDIYTVGRNGYIAHFAEGMWKSEPSGTGTNLTGVWGSGPGDVYVSVYSNVILHSKGDGKWAHETLEAGLTFEQVWGLGADTVFAVGGGVYRRNSATSWSLEANSTAGVDLWGTALANRYLVGPGTAKTVAHSTGEGKWSAQTSPPQSLYAVYGSAADHVFVGGVGGVYFSAGDGVWKQQLVLDPTTGNNVNAIWAASRDAVFACSEGGFVYRSNGAGTWSEGQAINGTGPVRNCNAIWGTGPDDLYVATLNGLFHGTLP